MNKIMKVTKTEKELGMDFILKLSELGKIAITNDFEHKIALRLVEAGQAIVTKKKNYGKIAEIKGV